MARYACSAHDAGIGEEKVKRKKHFPHFFGGMVKTTV